MRYRQSWVTWRACQLVPGFLGLFLLASVDLIAQGESGHEDRRPSLPTKVTMNFLNDCSSEPIYLAINYDGIIKGWYTLRYGEPFEWSFSNPQSRWLSFYAYDRNRQWGGESKDFPEFRLPDFKKQSSFHYPEEDQPDQGFWARFDGLDLFENDAGTETFLCRETAH